MSTREQGRLMDVATIQRELGVTRHIAEKIARQLPKVKLPETDKVYVKRVDLERLLAEHTIDAVAATARAVSPGLARLAGDARR